MKHGSTFFLKAVICLLALLAAGICTIMIGVISAGNAGIYLPILFGMLVTSLPFFFALYQGILLLRSIDTNTAFSEQSVTAITYIKYCAGGISVVYALLMPYIVYVAEKDDAPGAAVLGLVFMVSTLITAVFAAVLEKLLKNALDIKSENDPTV